ncbi:MAG: hypothetical protein ACRD3L_17200 [Terriglobales bacterium]
MGLIEMTNGKARLIPIVILIDGEYYDASAYKASPVPMALWSDTVYEGVHSGVSQGLFTVTTALENPETHEWRGEGTWLPASAIHARPASKESSTPRGMDDDEGPPVLRHAGAAKPKAPNAAPATPAAAPTPPSPNPPPAAAAPAAPSPASPQPPANETKPAAQLPPAEPDNNIPTLKRGIPALRPPEPLTMTPINRSKHGNSAKAAVAAPSQVFPAISALGGAELRPYSYSMTAEEEQQFRKKMLAMAADEVRARSRLLTAETVQTTGPAKNAHERRSAPAKLPQPTFEDVKLRVFDLNSSNEPILILSAKVHLPQSAKPKEANELQYLVTLVARQDVNADFDKVFSNVTDTSHLDIIPQMELIDAVDVDGDGPGELLFREIYDSGTAYVVYRVIGNQLYALFQGTP